MSRRTLKVAEILPRGWEDVFSPVHTRIGIGYDIATTTAKKSNPSSLAVIQQVGHSCIARLVLRWKTKDPEVARAILRQVITGLPHGLRARRLCIDATNERYFATQLRTEFAGLVPVELVVASEGTTYRGEEMNWKTYLGNQLVNLVDDGYLVLPAEEWLRRDLRQVVKDRGMFTCEVSEDGGHGDCFDSIKLGVHAVVAAGGPASAEPAGPVNFNRGPGTRPGVRNPLARKHETRRRLTA